MALMPFVPTMGALHEGHASLVRAAREWPRAMVMASIFVNPTQFGPNEDFSRYPRTLEEDLKLLEKAGADAVFVPSAAEMYPALRMPKLGAMEGAGSESRGSRELTDISIDPGPLAGVLEGAIRPGHFRGVCTVVAKLLNIVQPSHLLLGQKDFQQQAILRRMCRELDMPVEVVTCPTVREADGMAMSSRNRYLSAEERGRAVGLYEALTFAKAAYDLGERDARLLETGMRERLRARGLETQYAVVARAQTLALFGEEVITEPAVLLIAAKLGQTRLIDNMLL
jgi:pantoate--beta-alanine ligase